MTEGSSVRVHRVDAACDARPLPGMVRPPTLLCVPGLKESRSGYRVEDRDVVYLCVRPGSDFGTPAFAAECLAAVREHLPDDAPVDALAFSMGCSVLAQLVAAGLRLREASLISPAGHFNGTWAESLLRRGTAFGSWRYGTGFWSGLATFPTYVAGGANAWEYESLHRLAERVKVYAAASDPVHPNDVEKFAANKQIKLIEADGGHFGPKTYVPMLHRRKSRSPRRADKAPRPLHKKILSQMLQPYWVAHVVWVLCCAMLCQSQWGMLSSHPLTTLSYGYTYCGCWSLIEYVYHRALQHHVLRPTHWTHHRRPHDHKHLRSPAGMIQLYGGALCLLVYAVHAALGVSRYPPFYPWLAFCYLAFEFAHETAHKADPPAWLGACRDFHVQHHKTPWLNYGFVSPMCDHVFGTAHGDFAAPWASILAFGPIPFLSFFLLPPVGTCADETSSSDAESTAESEASTVLADSEPALAHAKLAGQPPAESPTCVRHAFVAEDLS
ncbi:hypothetical protein EMIHUDRAFT_465032 [Emiliania huxleyi CCMP1516]|uniref:Fatty acid hydroxylase domain-containing protein n=4 Tax=Emiliania huxleyi TaxID=2903 RepID=A0A0D3IK26_EMIH1|nr:hypothetical protein EMIHUDRAFT_465032 [Emiliania huxleyi CCMP1516]EOD11611.1 hypothetical protein EMIHUDRAFT_465032 [Emiliania huxleyi CCMP1516]|eukprot:XP_005764040.1 hypothetical protein EMIHUDRAFT_465032 [Emiliania huxleyi CCMP1516]